MKTIDAVIEQCEEIANASKQHTLHMTHFSQSYDEWAEEWTQIAEWLKELKAYRSRSENPNTCEDAVSREAAIRAIEALQRPIMREESNYYQFKFSGMSEALGAVENLPSVTPQPKTGRWVKEGQGGRYKWMCSNCGTHHRALYDYCPSCGTRMEVEE